MFTFLIQLLDFTRLNVVGLFFVFFIVSWVIYLIKLLKASGFKSIESVNLEPYTPSVSVIVPVVDEPIEIWMEVLQSLKKALVGIEHEVIVVPNGSNAVQETRYAENMGFNVIRVTEASKRLALEAGARYAKNEVAVILDSDTIVEPDSILKLIRVFQVDAVGGAVPRQKVFNRDANIFRRVSDWLEDIRFNEVLTGQQGAVGCLCGRLLAVRTKLLKQMMPELVSETFLGTACISGDDRFLTSWLLQRGWLTVYVDNALVHTNAPDTLSGFVKQRLRWSRTSFRETLRSLGWLWKYPFTAFTTLANVAMRWFYFVVIVTAVLSWVGLIDRTHYVHLPLWQLILGTIVGFFASGYLRQLRHLVGHPQDLKYLPAFLLLTSGVLTLVEWYGNITVKESNWMTRKVDK